MQAAGRDNEADTVGERIDCAGNFSAVRVTVEYAERTDQHGGEPQRGPQPQRHHDAEHQRRSGDAVLDKRQRNTRDADQRATGHDEGKGNWQEPDGRSAELRAPQSDRNHRDEVVEAEHRMQQSAHQAVRHAFLAVAKSGRGARQQDKNGKPAKNVQSPGAHRTGPAQ